MSKLKIISLIIPTLFIGCSTDTTKDGAPETIPLDISAIPDAVPRYELQSHSANPRSYTVLGKQYTLETHPSNYLQTGTASWYGTKFHEHKTANGETYDMFAMTAAHKTLPIPSYVQVTNMDNQQQVIVRINDRGPFHEDRIIDLSYAAAVKLGIQQNGTGLVEVKALEATQTNEAESIYLQLGVFGDIENANKLEEELRQVQFNPRIKTEQHQGNNRYKVQLGPILSNVEADTLIDSLNQLGITNSHFISEKNHD